MDYSITAKTGDAPIVQLGQTKNSIYGLDSTAKAKGSRTPTNESPK